jgi:hypothetical protein
MNNFVIGIIAVIAAILSFVLFGKPKNPSSQTADRTEQVEPIAPPRPSVPAIADPWDDRATVLSASLGAAGADLPASPAAIVSPVSSSMPPFAAIHDPKRPSTPALQDLSQELLALGRSQQMSAVPKLRSHMTHAEPLIRGYVAYALGQITAAQTKPADMVPIVALLNQLSQDRSPDVRQMATKALSAIKSTP